MGKHEKERDGFKSRTGFILACIGSAVGMGNIWRFPYMVSDWGGMTFLIPYILFVILIASTGVIEEMALGRAAKGGPIKAFGVCTEMRTGNKKTGELIGLLPVLGSLALAIGYTGKLREMGFTGKLQWIRTVRMNASMIQQCKKYDLDISAEYKNISMNDINNAHQNGIRISVWLCRNEDMVDIFRKMGADYITYEKWNTDEVKMRYYSHSTIPRGVLA